MDEDLAKAMEEEMAKAMAPSQNSSDSDAQRQAMEDEMAQAMGASPPNASGSDDLQKAMDEEMASAMGMAMGTPPEEISHSESQRRAVLAIKTPVTVTLARKRESLQRILELIPGSMLTFDTHCDEPLTLEAGGHPIATGETIKIGDKFGLRIREIIDYSVRE